MTLPVGSVEAYANRVTCNYILEKPNPPVLQYKYVRIHKEFEGGSCRVESASDFTARCAVPATAPAPVRLLRLPVKKLKPAQ